MNPALATYTEEHIKSLDWKDHIRSRPGMYIGRLGNGENYDDGIYVLIKEVLDNSVDEFMMGFGKKIDVAVDGDQITIRDYGRGIPLGKTIECVSKINTGAKYDEGAFFRSVGLNGVGTKAVNALSAEFRVRSIRDGKVKEACFEKGELVEDLKIRDSKERSGTEIVFRPDPEIFKEYVFRMDLIEERLWNYAFLNRGLTLTLNDKSIYSKNGLEDLLNKEVGDSARYPVIHVSSPDIEYALTHTDNYGESYLSFVNGQYTIDGGTHQSAYREGILKAFKEFFSSELEGSDARGGFVGVVLVRIHEPVFESQTKTKLGSSHVKPGGQTIRSWVVDYVRTTLVKRLHKEPEAARQILAKIKQNERERRDMAGIKKLSRERQKKANIHNKKLRDCKEHFNVEKDKLRLETELFITEGDSASGSLTKARNVRTQAVFALKGKPLNCYGKSKKVVYENEELNLLQHALGIEDSLEDLRYNRIIIATDADVDGMHIRLLLLTFFLQFFPEIVKKGHLHVLQTPLFRVRNKKETVYCYSEQEKLDTLRKLGSKAEITRFKGLGEISPDEFGNFIGEKIRLDTVKIPPGSKTKELLDYFMGKNTPERREFITSNLVIEPVDLVEERVSA